MGLVAGGEMKKKLWKPESLLFVEEMRKKMVLNSHGGGRGRWIKRGPWNCLASVARHCGSSPASMSLYLSKKREPTFWLAIRIANYLDIDLKQFKRLKWE